MSDPRDLPQILVHGTFDELIFEVTDPAGVTLDRLAVVKLRDHLSAWIAESFEQLPIEPLPGARIVSLSGVGSGHGTARHVDVVDVASQPAEPEPERIVPLEGVASRPGTPVRHSLLFVNGLC